MNTVPAGERVIGLKIATLPKSWKSLVIPRHSQLTDSQSMTFIGRGMNNSKKKLV